MKVCVDGVLRDATQEELEQAERDRRQYEVYEKFRPLTTEEVSQMMIKAQINTLSVDDNTALRMIAYYPEWSELTDQKATKDFKFTYQGKLYKVLQEHTFSSTWVPASGTESLYTRIDEEHDGDIYDPIPYEGNMALENGKYYTQNNVIYLCTRDTGNPVYNSLSELVGLYVRVV
jgi:hypothetical protein